MVKSSFIVWVNFYEIYMYVNKKLYSEMVSFPCSHWYKPVDG